MKNRNPGNQPSEARTAQREGKQAGNLLCWESRKAGNESPAEPSRASAPALAPCLRLLGWAGAACGAGGSQAGSHKQESQKPGNPLPGPARQAGKACLESLESCKSYLLESWKACILSILGFWGHGSCLVPGLGMPGIQPGHRQEWNRRRLGCALA